MIIIVNHPYQVRCRRIVPCEHVDEHLGVHDAGADRPQAGDCRMEQGDRFVRNAPFLMRRYRQMVVAASVAGRGDVVVVVAIAVAREVGKGGEGPLAEQVPSGGVLEYAKEAEGDDDLDGAESHPLQRFALQGEDHRGGRGPATCQDDEAALWRNIKALPLGGTN